MTLRPVAGQEWWKTWRGELVMVAVACSLVLLAFPLVIFGGRTFQTGWMAVAVNGFHQPPPDVDVPPDGILPDAGASAWAFEPWAEVEGRIWHDGEVPLWNPYQGMGAPLLGNLQSAVFDPLLAGVHFHPTPLMWDFSFILAFCLGSAAMYLFLRQIGLSRGPSLIGTAPWVLSGFFFVYSNNHFFRSYLYLPLLLLLAHRTFVSGGRGNTVALGVALAAHLVIGMPEASFFVLGTLTLYCLYLLAVPPTPVSRRSVIVRLGAAAILGLALAAPVLLPGFEFLASAHSIHEPGSGLGALVDAPPELLRWLMPYALGEKGQPFAGTKEWVGMGSALAAVVAVASPKVMRRHAGWPFLGLAALLLAKNFGFPLLRWTAGLPLLERLIFVVYSLPIAAFSIAVLVGIGAQSIHDREVHRPLFFGLAALLALGFGDLIRLNSGRLETIPTSHLVRHLIVAAFAAGAVGLAVVLARRWPAVALLLVGIGVMGELLALAPRGFQQDRIDPYIRPAWLQHILEQAGPTHERVYGTDAKLFPNVAGAYGLQDIRSLDAVYSDRYVGFVRAFIQPSFHDRFVGGPFASQETGRGETDANPMFDLTGVRFVVTGGQVPGDGKQFQRVAASDGAEVYENSARLPRALVVHAITAVPDETAALDRFRSQSDVLPSGALRVRTFDPGREAVVEGLSGPAAGQIRGCDRSGTAKIRSYRANRVTVETDGACPGLLLLTDLYYPGWTATVDGTSTPVLATDLAFRGVPVPAGRAVVTFKYRPRSFTVGLSVAMVGAVVVLLTLLLPYRRRAGPSPSIPLRWQGSGKAGAPS